MIEAKRFDQKRSCSSGETLSLGTHVVMFGLGRPSIQPLASAFVDGWILGTPGSSPSAGKPEDDSGKHLLEPDY
jgi:hypothetical protein